jgi:subtilisin
LSARRLAAENGSMNDAMDGRRTTAHGALLVTIGILLCAALPASAAAATKPYIVVYKTTSAPASRAATSDIAADENVKPTQRFTRAVRGFAARLDATDVAHIRKDERVAKVVPDLPVRASALVPILAGDNVPPGVRRVGAAVDGSVREASLVNVAVIDTGIDLTHPDLNAATGIDCTGSGTASDGNGHGTHVAGTIGARNNGSGAVGVAPGTKVWAVRVLGANGSGLTSQVICGIDWVTATRTDANPNNDITVANMSLGSSAPSNDNCGRTVGDAMHIAICNSVAAGVTYVVAAGNSGGDEQNFVPASYPEVITATAIADSDGLPGARGGALSCTAGADDAPASFSNYATRAADIARTIAAPGTCIRSTYPGGYATMSGTSMASPHVAGLVALCEGDGTTRGPCWGKTPDQVRTFVRQAAADQSAADPSSGFAGDPTRPAAGHYYGYLGSTRFPATIAPPATPVVNTVKPAVSGAAAVGSTLTSSTGTWTGSAPIGYARQWLRCTTSTTTACTAISGATGASYAIAAADASRYIRVRVSASNAKGPVDALSNATAAVIIPVVAPARASPAVVSGAATVGSTLTSTAGTWTGTAPIALALQWLRCTSSAPTTCVAITGAKATTYKLTAADSGRYLRMQVTASNSKGSASSQSEPTAVVSTSAAKPAVVTPPAIGGTMRVGSTLTATPGTWTGGAPMTFAFAWAACAPGSTTCYYNGVTGPTFTPPPGTPVGTRVVLIVTAQNAAGVSYGQSMTSAPLAAR